MSTPTHRAVSEPALSIGSISALVSAILAMIVVLGVNLPTGFEAALLAVIAAAGPIVGAIITRARVTPTVEVVEHVDGARVIAGAASELPTGQYVRDTGSLDVDA